MPSLLIDKLEWEYSPIKNCQKTKLSEFIQGILEMIIANQLIHGIITLKISHLK